MMNKICRISEAELEVMKILWEAAPESLEGSPFRQIGTNDIVKRLQAEKGWDRSTVRTLIKRLVEKEAVFQEKEKTPSGKQETCFYWAAIGEGDYVEEQTKGFIDKLYRGSAKNLVAALVDNNALSKEDLAELKDFFEGK